MNAKKKMSLARLKNMKEDGQKIVCLTAYDAAMAHWEDEAGVDMILVGDSLGMVVQGHATTLPTTLEEMVYHTQLVQRGSQYAWCVADLPFMSERSLDKALDSAMALMKHGQANMVKLEGGSQRVLEIVTKLSELGVPVCAHLGFLPQSVEKNGYKMPGQGRDTAKNLTEEALALQAAGADMLVLECVPNDLAQQMSEQLAIPTIGIGSGKGTDGQVLVVNDLLGMTVGGSPKFAKNFLQEADSIQAAITNYVTDVRAGRFPE